jgi:capsular polysaccharide biosynthesis protein
MSEQALDIQAVLSILRRRRRVIVAAGLLGAIVGVLFVIARPPLYSSATVVLLPPQQDTSGQLGGRDMVTETRIVTSDAVLGEARKMVHPELTREQVAALVTADSPSQDMLHIVAQGATKESAESLAHAVAKAELDYQQSASSSLSNAEQAALDKRMAGLKDQLTSVNQEMVQTKKLLDKETPDSPQARAAQTALAQLTAQQSKLVLGVEAIEAERTGALTGKDAQLLQDASPAKQPRLVVWLVVSALIFTVIGIGLAAAVVVALARRDPRLRTRDQIADALGSPVIGSVKSHRVRTTAAWSQLLESYHPSAVDAWSLRQVLDGIGVGPLLVEGASRNGVKRSQMSLVAVVLADDSSALAVAGQLASHTASLGVSTRLTARQRHAFADPLWATSTMRDRGAEVRPGLWVDPRRRKSPVDLVVELAVVDRQQPVLPEVGRAAVVLIVSAGTATEEDLARVAVATYERGGRFRGIVVADPDSLDHTTGRLLQAQRAVEPAMPQKLTGLEPDNWRESEGGRS